MVSEQKDKAMPASFNPYLKRKEGFGYAQLIQKRTTIPLEEGFLISRASNFFPYSH
jgi:hypothetical protein